MDRINFLIKSHFEKKQHRKWIPWSDEIDYEKLIIFKDKERKTY